MITVDGVELRNLEETVQYLNDRAQAGGGFNVKGIVSQLPTHYEVGDIYGVGVGTNIFYYYRSPTQWVSMGTFKGLKGDTGAQGEQGVKGDTGERGSKGDPGAQGLRGTDGIGLQNMSEIDLSDGGATVTQSGDNITLDNTGKVKYDVNSTRQVDTKLVLPLKGTFGIDVAVEDNKIQVGVTSEGAAPGKVLTASEFGAYWADAQGGGGSSVAYYDIAASDGSWTYQSDFNRYRRATTDLPGFPTISNIHGWTWLICGMGNVESYGATTYYNQVSAEPDGYVNITEEDGTIYIDIYGSGGISTSWGQILISIY